VSQLFTDLAWLPKPKDDLRSRCKALLSAKDGVGQEIIKLASQALDSNQLTSLAKSIDRLRDQGTRLAPLTPFRLGILGNGTLDLLVGPLVATAARFGIALECIMSEYDEMLYRAVTRGLTFTWFGFTLLRVLIRLEPDRHPHERAGCERYPPRPLAVVRDLDAGPVGMGRDRQVSGNNDLVWRVDRVLPLDDDDVEYRSSGRHCGGRCAVECTCTTHRVQEFLTLQ
jgi:hypothetical protein